MAVESHYSLQFLPPVKIQLLSCTDSEKSLILAFRSMVWKSFFSS